MARKLGLLALVAACSGAQSTAPQPSREGSALPAADTAKPDTDDDTDGAPAFRVDVAPPPSCARDQPCEARILLTALEPYKVNEEYPFKFVADANPRLAFDGTGTFARTDPRSATHTIRFRADATGTVKVTGKFKLSVCTDATCKIEAPTIAFEVAIRD